MQSLESIVREIVSEQVEEEKQQYQFVYLTPRIIEIPVWHTQHSFENKNRNDYNRKYDIDKRKITDEELLGVYQKTSETFITLVREKKIKENDSYLIKPNFSTINAIGSLEKPKQDKRILNWLIRTITIRRNELSSFEGEVIIREDYDRLQQRLKYIITKLSVPIEIQIRLDKRILDRLPLNKLQELHNHLNNSQNNIFNWIISLKSSIGEKSQYRDKRYQLDIFINSKTPFNLDLGIVDIK
jgi:hypothetical protein